jgi:hypothetical protein
MCFIVCTARNLGPRWGVAPRNKNIKELEIIIIFLGEFQEFVVKCGANM